MDPRFQCAIALSPQPGGGRANSPLHKKSWEHIQVPTLVVTGSRDFNWMPPVKANPRLVQMPYDGLPPGDNISSRSRMPSTTPSPIPSRIIPARERDPRHHVWIQQATTAFLDAYLKGDATALDSLKRVTLETETHGECRQEQKPAAGSSPSPQNVKSGDVPNPGMNVAPWRLRSGADAKTIGGGGPHAVGVIENLTLRDAKRGKDLPLRVTYPEGQGKFPIILFSHCAGGSAAISGRWCGTGRRMVMWCFRWITPMCERRGRIGGIARWT